MKKTFYKHLLNNNGDIYIYFLIAMLAVVLMFSAVFGLQQLRIMTNNVYNEIETSADVVIANIKKDCYQTLIDGTTENSKLPTFSKDVVTQQLAEQLNASNVASQIIKKSDDQTLFVIRDIKVIYNDKNADAQISEINGGILKITFNIEIPIKFNGNIIYTINKTYTKNTMLNFK